MMFKMKENNRKQNTKQFNLKLMDKITKNKLWLN